MPINDLDLEDELQLQQLLEQSPPQPMALPPSEPVELSRPEPQMLPAPSGLSKPLSQSDLVKQAISKRMAPGLPAAFSLDALSNARQQANQNLQGINVLNAGQDLAYAISGAKNKPDNQMFDVLRQQAASPVADLEAKRKAYTGNLEAEKSLRESEQAKRLDDPASMASKVEQSVVLSRLQGLNAKLSDDDLNAIRNSSASELKDIQKALEHFETSDYKKKLAELSNSWRQKSLESREKNMNAIQDRFQARLGKTLGDQAANAAKAFNNDKLIQTTTSQQAQIEKALGRLEDIQSGKTTFNKSIKADIEKDIANIISNGNNSSLGQLDRIEFEPYIAQWNNFLSKVRGLQLDIGAPQYAAQLKTLLEGLHRDIKFIQSKRAKFIGDSIGPAYEKNPLAVKTIERNVGLRQPQVAEESAPVKQQMSSYTKDVLGYAKAHRISPEQALAIKLKRTGGK